MARPVKHNLQYFPLDVDFFEDHKVLMIEEDFGIKGGYLAVRLMAMVYAEGYYLEWKDKFEHSCAKRVGNGFTGSLVCEILKSCLIHGLFDKGMFERHRILTSRGIQKRWIQVMSGIRRKVSISSEFNLISSEETRISSEETTTPATFSTQKEMKRNEKKENVVVPAKPSPPVLKPKNSKKKKPEEPPEPHWQALVDAWFGFVREKFGDEPSFARDDPKILKRIIGRLKKRAQEKAVEWVETAALERFRAFLDKAYLDRWLAENFLLANLEKQFDKIILNHQKTNGIANGKPHSTVGKEIVFDRP